MGTSERRSEVKGEEDVKIPAFTSLWLYVEREGEREDFVWSLNFRSEPTLSSYVLRAF